MKNACIAVRGRAEPFSEDFERPLNALLEGGYCADKTFLLAEGEEHEFAQTVIECKNFFDNVIVAAREQVLPKLRARVAELLGVVGGAELVSGTKRFFCIPFGEGGERAVRGEVLPALRERDAAPLSRSFLRAVGAPAERLAAAVRAAEGVGGVICSVSERHGEQRLVLSYASDIAKSAADEALRAAAEVLDEFTYAIDDTPLAQRVFELLKLRGTKLSVAESFTGGGVASALIAYPGMSKCLIESVVTYSNASKISRLGVSSDVIAKRGAVSDDCVFEMANGLLSDPECEIAVATTGNAGPTSEKDGNVGLYYIAIGDRNAVHIFRNFYVPENADLKSDVELRREITESGIKTALFELGRYLKNKKRSN